MNIIKRVVGLPSVTTQPLQCPTVADAAWKTTRDKGLQQEIIWLTERWRKCHSLMKTALG